MPDIAFTREYCTVSDLVGDDTDAINAFCHINDTNPGIRLMPNTPYCLKNDPLASPLRRRLAAMPAKDREKLRCCVEQFGDLTAPLAAFYDEHLAFLDLQKTGGLLGAGLSAR